MQAGAAAQPGSIDAGLARCPIRVTAPGAEAAASILPGRPPQETRGEQRRRGDTSRAVKVRLRRALGPDCHTAAMAEEGTQEDRPRRQLRTARMEAFSDGIFTIASTLLVIELATNAASSGRRACAGMQDLQPSLSGPTSMVR
ncbi:TMEM175 family protein [Streptomyces lavendulae]|uniref:TMEM175 family protein n=1 Tax=Streptomyces lavendulae TaxID=1914 RepID=UPI0033DC6C76